MIGGVSEKMGIEGTSNEEERMAKCVVGRFELEDGILSGPAQYMAERGDTLVDAIFAGEDMIFNTTAHLSPNIETALLVRLQTDYAGWLGMKQVEGWLSSSLQTSADAGT